MRPDWVGPLLEGPLRVLPGVRRVPPWAVCWTLSTVDEVERAAASLAARTLFSDCEEEREVVRVEIWARAVLREAVVVVSWWRRVRDSAARAFWVESSFLREAMRSLATRWGGGRLVKETMGSEK